MLKHWRSVIDIEGLVTLALLGLTLVIQYSY